MNGRSHVVLPLLTVLFGIAPIVRAQTPVTIQINDPRPLKSAVDSLEDKIKVPVNYEDPRFESPADIEDVTDRVQSPRQKAAHPNVRILIPKGGDLTVSGTVSASPTSNDVIPVFTLLEAQHEAKGYPGRFAIRQVDGIATVEPIAVRASDGSWKTVSPAMNVQISFPSQQRNAAAALALIAKALSQKLGIQVGVGRFPMVAFANATVMLGANDEAANLVLGRLFDQLSTYYSKTTIVQPMYSYRLLYDPGVKCYFLHITVVAPKANQVSAAAPAQKPPKGFLMQLPDK